MPMRGQLHHVEINVSSLEKSREFWSWFLGRLGYKKYQSWKQGASWKLGSTYIVIVQTREKHLTIPYHRSATGLNHLAFHAGWRKEVDIITKELRPKRINILYTTKHPFAGGPDHYAVYFEDPDRIKVELIAPQNRSKR